MKELIALGVVLVAVALLCLPAVMSGFTRDPEE